MKHMMTILAIVATSSLVASDIPVSWTAGATPASLGDGALTLQYDQDGKVLKLTVSPAAGDRVVVSGDAITFASDSQIEFADRGGLVFENAVAGSGNVTLTRTEDAIARTYSGTLLYTNQYTEMFQNMSLAAWKPVRSDRGSGTGVFDPNNVYFPYHIVNYTGADGLPHQKFQLQVYNGGAFRAILVDLKEENGSVYGMVRSAFYGAARMMLGEDIEKVVERNAGDPETGMQLNYYVHTPASSGGYGVSHLIMERADGCPELVFGSTVASAINFTLGDDLQTGDRIRVVGCTAFNNVVSGLGTVSLQSAPSAKDPYVETVNGFVNKTAVTIPGRSLDDFVSIDATITGTYLNHKEFAATTVNYVRSGDVATFELQCYSDSTTWRYVTMELRKEGGDLQLKTTDAGYVKNGSTDIRAYVGNYSVYEEPYNSWRTSMYSYTPTTQTECPVCAKDFSVTFGTVGGRTSETFSPTAFSVSGLAEPIDPTSGTQPFFEDMKVVLSGNERSTLMANFSTEACAPSRGILEVNGGAEVKLTAKQANATSLIRVNEGGKVRLSRSEPANYDQNFVVDGGELVFRDDLAPDYGDTWAYINLLSLRNGGQVTGASSIRVGYISSPVWRITGDYPSECVPSILLITSSNGPEFNVTDVTDDAGEDFILRGAITVRSDNTNSKLRKTGAGTLAHYGSVTGVRSLRVEKGVWMFAGSASGGQTFTLAGGDLAAKAGTVNTMGSLVVSAPAKLTVGAGATLAIADSSAASWTLGAKEYLELDADLANGAVRVGSSASALTAAQLDSLRCNHGANRVTIDENGYLRVGASAIPPFLLMVR